MKDFSTAGGQRFLAAVILMASFAASCLMVTPEPARGGDISGVFVVNSTGDGADAVLDGICNTQSGPTPECTLRAAVQEANAVPGRANIMLPAGEYTLTIPHGSPFNVTVGDLDVTDDLIIAGAGARTTIVQGGGRHTTTGTSKPALPRRSVVLL